MIRRYIVKNRPLPHFFHRCRNIILKPKVPLLILFLTIYVFTSGGHFYVVDQVFEYVTVQAIAEHGNLNIAFALPLLHSLGIRPGYVPGRSENGSTYYPIGGLLQPILSVPFYYLGVLFHVEPWRAISMLYTPLISAISVSLLYSIARRIGASPKNSLALGLMYGLAAILWWYSKAYFDVSTATVTLLAAAYFLVGKDSDLKSGVACGFFATLSIFARTTQVIMLPGFIAYLLLHHTETAKGRYHRLLAFMIPIIIGGVSFACANWVMFGSPLTFAYGPGASNPLNTAAYSTNPLLGIFGLLFSAGYGLFVFYPLCAVGFFVLLVFEGDRGRRFAFAWFFLANLFFYSRGEWSGGGNFGARYMVVAAPYLILGLEPFVRNVGASLSRYAILWVGAAWGFIVNLLGVLINIDYVGAYLFDVGHFGDNWSGYNLAIRWIPSFSRLSGAWALLWSLVYPAVYYPSIPASSMFYLRDRFDLLLYSLYGFPALLIFLLVVFAESFWLFKAIVYGKSNVRKRKPNRNMIQDVKGKQNKR